MFDIRAASSSQLDDLRAIDDDASALFLAHGVVIDLPPEHEFARAEQARWRRAAELGRAFVAVDTAGASLGFTALDLVDGEPYLDQLAVRTIAMRRGIGAALLRRALEWARGQHGASLWLTTYAHLPFNRPYYERHDFFVVPEASCGAELVHHLAEQRLYLPAPSERVAMRRPL